MEPSHLSPTERTFLKALAGRLQQDGNHDQAALVESVIAAHAHPAPCITSRVAFGVTLPCVGSAGHDGPHTAIDSRANVHAVWTDDQD